MAEQDNKARLFDEFPPVTPQAWKEKIVADLKGADYDKRLVWRTPEGFALQPFYTAADLEGMGALESQPGEYPFVRGNKAQGNAWRITQAVCAADPALANAEAREALAKGATAVAFVLDPDRGYTQADIEQMLAGVDLGQAEINFRGAADSAAFAAAFDAAARALGAKADTLQGSVEADPISHLMLRGRYCCAADTAFGRAAQAARALDAWPGVRTATVGAIHLANAGVTTSQELGYALAIGCEYMDRLTAQGLTPAQANAALRFHFGVGGNYFFEIAKFRAARMLWSQVATAFGVAPADARMHIHAETSQWNKTVYDQHTNVLRTTTEAMSAVLGGVESLEVNPFDNTFEAPTELSERVARNQQVVLKNEAYLDKTADPAGGSYYIETLTREIAQAAWQIFTATEAQGGFAAAFLSGAVQSALADTAARRADALANRRDSLLGTNQFPCFTEQRPDIAPEALEPIDLTAPDAQCAGLVRFRGAQPYERLRHRTDLHAKSNKRPLAFMVPYGPVAWSNARSQFAQNFMAVAGFAVKDNASFASAEAGCQAALEAGADIVVLCSADEEYAATAPAAAQLAKGKALVVVAGNPKESVEALTQAGVDSFIHVKSNVLDTLARYQEQLGIK